MAPIAVRPDAQSEGERRFRAVAGERQSVGRTMGEALDALVAESGGVLEETAVFIQCFRADAYFTEAQQLRMRELLGRRDSLSAGERGELEALLDAELDATVARTGGLVEHAP